MSEKVRHRGGASKKLVVLVLLIAAMVPLVGAVLSGGSNKNAQTTADTTVTGQSRTVCLSLPMFTISQTMTQMIASKGVPFDSPSTDYSMAKYAFSRGPVAYRSGGTADPLTNGVTVTGFVNGTGDWEMWYMNVSSGAIYMRIVLAAQLGNYLSVYGRLNAYPTTSSYNWSQTWSNSIDLSRYNPQAGKWYVMAYSSSGKGTYLLTVTVLYSSTPQLLTSGTPATGSLNATADSDLWDIDVASGATSMHSVLTCPSGADFDLYGSFQGYPYLVSYSWRGNAAGNEDVIYSYPAAGRWYIMPYSYSGNGTYQLTVTITYASVVQSLSNGVTVTGSLNGTGASDIWYISVLSGATMMHSVLSCPSGANFDLYGDYGVYPTTSYYYWRGVTNGSEDVAYSSPSSGYWYIMVNSQNGSGTYQLTVTLTYQPSPQYLYSGTTVTGSLSGNGAYDLWYIYVSSGATSLYCHITFSYSSGANFDLYGACGYYPTTSYYDWVEPASYVDITHSSPSVGYWYIMVRANSGSGTYSLTVTVNYGSQGPPDPIAILAPIVIIFIVVALFILVLAASSRGNTLGSGRGPNYRQSQAPPTEAGMEEEDDQQVVAVRMVQCKSCGASMKLSDSNCWNCGVPAKGGMMGSSATSARTRNRARSGICMVCKRGLEKGEEILFCPYCGGLAHKDHMLEWLHVKDYCPTCGRHLDEAEVRKQTEPQSTSTNKRRRA